MTDAKAPVRGSHSSRPLPDPSHQASEVSLEATLARLIDEGGYKGNRKRVAAAVGVTPGALSQYLAGKTRPSFNVLLRLASFFGVTLDFLVYGREMDGRAAVDYGPLARYIDISLAGVQEHTARHSALVARIGRAVGESIDHVAAAVVNEGKWRPDMMPDEDTLTLEGYAVTTQLVSLTLSYDVIEMPGADEAAGGRFLPVVAENLAKGYEYEILLPKSPDRDWTRLVAEHKRMLRGLVGADAVATHCRFAESRSPLFAGMGLYRLDVARLRSEHPILHAQWKANISSDGWIGYLLPPSDDLRADAVLDARHLASARRVFSELWSHASRIH